MEGRHGIEADYFPSSSSLTPVCDGDVTPEARTGSLSPPVAPGSLTKFLRNDLEDGVRRGCKELVELALVRNSSCRDSRFHYIHEAARRAHYGAVEFLLHAGRGSINELNESCGGRRVLDIALDLCFSDQDVGYRMAELFLTHGAEVDAAHEPYSALHGMTCRGNIVAIRLLLLYRADVDLPDERGMSPLHLACGSANEISSPRRDLVAKLLLDHAASPLQEDRAGLRPVEHVRNHTTLHSTLLRAEAIWVRRNLFLARGSGRRINVCHATSLFFQTEVTEQVFALLS
eukprot:TRINITY_DN28386_c0_g1_i1.p1 TRINITY_DN28386_c0_g1~~TRINITY_DN28386_c0_g1_i1.p1  ORF type:complete len:288 (+),score=22.29 TRINITY_DN28386_c0_g1_i1:151-1014(+)